MTPTSAKALHSFCSDLPGNEDVERFTWHTKTERKRETPYRLGRPAAKRASSAAFVYSRFYTCAVLLYETFAFGEIERASLIRLSQVSGLCGFSRCLALECTLL